LPTAPAPAPAPARRKEHKEQVLQKKLKLKKNYTTIHESVLLWEKLRQRSAGAKEKQQLARTITKKARGTRTSRRRCTGAGAGVVLGTAGGA
jgi:hypothetical protein